MPILLQAAVHRRSNHVVDYYSICILLNVFLLILHSTRNVSSACAQVMVQSLHTRMYVCMYVCNTHINKLHVHMQTCIKIHTYMYTYQCTYDTHTKNAKSSTVSALYFNSLLSTEVNWHQKPLKGTATCKIIANLTARWETILGAFF